MSRVSWVYAGWRAALLAGGIEGLGFALPGVFLLVRCCLAGLDREWVQGFRVLCVGVCPRVHTTDIIRGLGLGA